MSNAITDVHGNLHGADDGRFQEKRTNEAVLAGRKSALVGQRSATLAAVAKLNDKLRDQEAALFILEVAELAKKVKGAHRLSFIFNRYDNKITGVDVHDNLGKWLKGFGLVDVYTDEEYRPTFVAGNLHGCFEEQDKEPSLESGYPSFSVTIADAEMVDPDDAGSPTKLLEAALRETQINDVNRFMDRVRSSDIPAGATALRLRADDFHVQDAEWIDAEDEAVADAGESLFADALNLRFAGLSNVHDRFAGSGLSHGYDGFEDRSHFLISVDPAAHQ